MYQISLKSDDFSLRYGKFTIFKMADLLLRIAVVSGALIMYKMSFANDWWPQNTSEVTCECVAGCDSECERRSTSRQLASVISTANDVDDQHAVLGQCQTSTW